MVIRRPQATATATAHVHEPGSNFSNAKAVSGDHLVEHDGETDTDDGDLDGEGTPRVEVVSENGERREAR
jgi:hypothetical protein